MGQHIPAEVEQIAQAQQLGIPRREYDTWSPSSSPRSRSSMLKLIYPAIFILFICGLLALWYQLSGGGVQSWQLALIIVFGSFIALIIWSGGGKATTKRFHVYLCSYGLLRLSYDHSDVQVIRWEQIEKIWRRVSTYYPEQ